MAEEKLFTVDEIENVINSLTIEPNMAKLIINQFKNKKYDKMIEQIRNMYIIARRDKSFRCKGGLAYLFHLLDTNEYNIIDFNPEKIYNIIYNNETYFNCSYNDLKCSQLNMTFCDPIKFNTIEGHLIEYPMININPVKDHKKIGVIHDNINRLDQILFNS